METEYVYVSMYVGKYLILRGSLMIELSSEGDHTIASIDVERVVLDWCYPLES